MMLQSRMILCIIVVILCVGSVVSFNPRPVMQRQVVRSRFNSLGMMTPIDIHDAIQTANLHHQFQHLSTLFTTDEAAVVSDAAQGAVSVYSKVDKTGFIGFIADYIERTIDFGHSVFQGFGLNNAYGYSIILFTVFGWFPRYHDMLSNE